MVCLTHASYEDLVRWLLFVGEAAMDLKTVDGSTPLHAAASHGRLDVLRLLVEVGWAPTAAEVPGIHGSVG